MCDDAVRLVMPVMRIISAEMLTRYPGLFWREVPNRCVIAVCYFDGY